MVEVVQFSETLHEDYNGGHPLVHIHHIERHVFGNGIAIKVFGELLIAAKEVVFAKELKLQTIQVLNLTAESGAHTALIPQKWIYHKGEYGNYASIDIFNDSGTEQTAGTGPSVYPAEGSVWLDFIALGE